MLYTEPSLKVVRPFDPMLAPPCDPSGIVLKVVGTGAPIPAPPAPITFTETCAETVTLYPVAAFESEPCPAKIDAPAILAVSICEAATPKVTVPEVCGCPREVVPVAVSIELGIADEVVEVVAVTIVIPLEPSDVPAAPTPAPPFCVVLLV